MTLSTWQVIQLFWWNKWNSMFGSCKPIKNKMITLHEHGTQRVLKSFDLVKICNDIKYLKLLAKFQINPSLETQFFIRHSHKSIIYLDEIYKAKSSDIETEDEVVTKGEEKKERKKSIFDDLTSSAFGQLTIRGSQDRRRSVPFTQKKIGEIKNFSIMRQNTE